MNDINGIVYNDLGVIASELRKTMDDMVNNSRSFDKIDITDVFECYRKIKYILAKMDGSDCK